MVAQTAALLVLLPLLPVGVVAQTGNGTLRGMVADQSGATVPGATVTVTGVPGVVKVVTTREDGKYATEGLPPGKYTIRVAAKGFRLFEKADVVVSDRQPQTLDIQLQVGMEKQEVTVADAAKPSVSPLNSLGAIVLKGEDLNAFSDNPDDLLTELQALAGPAAGPNGGQIYIDGFTGGRLPPKESIREIRINQSPFSAEYDRLGFGRIEIFTKPGTEKYHGMGFFIFGDSAFNSRNPFAPTKPPYQSRQFAGNVGGPLGKKASFFIDAEQRNTEEMSVVSALTLDSSFNVMPFSEAILNPAKRTAVSPRIDYQLSPNNTLMGRYSYSESSRINEGVGQFSLPSQAYDAGNSEHTAQLTETAVLATKAVNETRFQYIRRRDHQKGDNSGPTISVLSAFTDGGASVGEGFSREDRYELQNYTSLTLSKHLLKLGARLRRARLSDSSTQNYNGIFTFTSLDAYRITLQGLQEGLSLAEIHALGGGPSQFSITGGDPTASVSQWDLGVFIQDDWRLRPNVSISAGVRYETQNNVRDHADVAPRVSFAWGLDKGQSGQLRTVLRAGVGIFYNRFSEDLTLQARRLNGVTQQQFVIPIPDFYLDVPLLETLAGNEMPQAIRKVDSDLRAPYVAQTAVSLERQLPKNITVAVTYMNSHGVHVLRSRNINAPLPGTYDPLAPDSGARPYGDVGDIYQYESTGLFNQNQLITNFRVRASRRLSLFGFYMLNQANSNTDGAGSFPANQYDMSGEYGSAAFDVLHRFLVGGSIEGPYGFRLNPLVVANSGQPFNIVVGSDLNADSLFNDRPAFATDLTRASVVWTSFGTFDTDPIAGQTIIPRNYGRGPREFTLNLRLGKTISFGGSSESRGPTGPPPGGPGGGRGGGPPGGGPGGGLGPGGLSGGGPPPGMLGGSLSRRYTLEFNVMARNLLNNVNLAAPIGNLSSPLFGRSNALAGGMFSSSTANRRIEFQVMFRF
jgi:Carboxypeptidase regulatory-like domain